VGEASASNGFAVQETRASTAGPEEFEQHLVAGGELLRRDEVAAARSELAAALELRPDDLKALGLLGLACFRQSAFDDALPIYQKMVELRPDDASHRLNLGLVYLKVGQADRAIQELSRSRDLDPSQPRTVSYLGLAHARHGNYADAFEAFLRARQEQLAEEMEQYLTAEEQDRIRARVSGDGRESGRRPALVVPDPADDETEDAEAAVVGEEDDHPARRTALDEDDAISEFEEEGVITRAVALAVPAAPTAVTGTRVGAGQEPPRALTELATGRLIRPQDGDHPFEIGAGGVLIVRVNDRVLSRIEDVVVMVGELAFEPAMRHVRGAATTETFGDADRPLSVVTGHGYLVASPAGQCFTAVALDDDILYLREGLVFAFEDQLRWENGHVPGASAELRTILRVVQFRGHGCVALRSRRPLLSLKLTSEHPVQVEARVLAGWIGRVVPRLVGMAMAIASRGAFVECSGEGVVLLEDQGGA
jgi:Flp pilus assembly protein TadD/uncharacterized protein (AIM24 family)